MEAMTNVKDEGLVFDQWCYPVDGKVIALQCLSFRIFLKNMRKMCSATAAVSQMYLCHAYVKRTLTQ